MFERYTEQARRSIFFARYATGYQGAAYITVAHLLIGLSWEGKTRAPGIGSLKDRVPELCALLGIPWPIGRASGEQLKADLPLDNNSKWALAYAAEEADRDGKHWIDKDHLLRGILRFPNEARTAIELLQLDLLTDRGASRRHRARLSDQPAPSSIPGRMGSGQAHGTVAKGRTTGASLFGRYTEQARRAIFFAHFEAIHRRAEAISLAHLFLGISWDENSRAAVVGSLKDKLLDICAALGVPVRPSTEIPYDRKVVIPLDDTSKIVLAFAVEEADGDGQYWIDTDHLLRGLLRFRNDVSTALEAVQLDLATVRAASKRHQSEFPPNPPPSLMPGGNSFGEGPRMVSRPFLTLAVLALVELLVLVTLAWLK